MDPAAEDSALPGRFAEQRPQRVRVQAPEDSLPELTGSTRENTAEEYYVQQLIRSQFRLALSVAAGFLAILVGISTLFALWPDAYDYTLWHIPMPWWILGVCIYPLILVAGTLYNRAASRNEKRYRSISHD